MREFLSEWTTRSWSRKISFYGFSSYSAMDAVDRHSGYL